ncbi:hypothetical protein L6164_013410 [Bauhinia variegata]|uniref:Uncharacterized protein n=1 Tax=Bauhinia variegata TaxID=167791 RepID=A0ACB9NHP3_BAUVA|nr:hypothetical protein L6164_013410 [Bauhinia variegata]
MASSLLASLICLLILPLSFVFAQTRSKITVGDSLSAGNSYSTWLLSPSGDFAFGFHPIEGNQLFVLSIWYAKLINKTIVWYANGDNPAPRGSTAQLTVDRGLVLTAPGGELLWTSETLLGSVAGGFLNDAGNLVLEDSKSKVVWESFKNPKDTLLPSQILERKGRLSSRLSETNLARGRFEIVFQDDGNLVFHSVNLPTDYANENYFESGTVKSSLSSAGLELVFDKSGDLYILRENNEKVILLPKGKASPSESYLRATLNFDGVFALYEHPKVSSGKDGWTPLVSLPDNICVNSLVSAGSGVCGYNSICTLNEIKRPICHCPKGYSLLDPKDPYGSCKADFIQGCKEDELSQRKDLYEYVELINTDWPLSDYVLLKPFTEEKCKQSCMEDCFCAVAIFRLGDSCWKKRLPLSNGRFDLGLNGGKAFIKVRKDNSSQLG